MKTEKLQFDIYGIQVEVNIQGPCCGVVAQFFMREFSFFSAACSKPTLVFHLREEKSSYQNKDSLIFKTRDCHVYGWGTRRYCQYGIEGSVFARNSKDHRSFEISSPIIEELIEISFMSFLSAVGEELDRNGYHRVHALGFEFKGKGVLAVLPQGAGKSALAALLKNEFTFLIASDENPLLKNGVMFPFPNALALHENTASAIGIDTSEGYLFSRRSYRPKLRFPWKKNQIARPISVEFIINGRESSSISISECHRLHTLKTLSLSMITGIGLAQMKEHMLRVSTLGSLMGIACSRTKEAIKVTKQSQSFMFKVEKDARANANHFSKFLNSI